MKYHFGIKLLAFLLAACLLLTLAGSALSIIFLGEHGLYTQSISDMENSQMENRATDMAQQLLQRYTAKKLGGLTKEELYYANRGFSNSTLSDWYGMGYDSWDYWIQDLDGKLMENGVRMKSTADTITYTISMSCDYPVHATPEESAEIEQTQNWNYRDYYYTETEEHFLYYYTSPSYLISIRFQPGQMQIYTGVSRDVLNFLYDARYGLIGVLIGSLVLFILCVEIGRAHV